MMTIEQALEIKQNWTFEQAKNDLEKLLLRGEKPADKVVALACKALEKQIPKKPISNSHDMFGIKCCICPVCHCHVYSTSNDFCHRCGQALDWSDVK
jgi:hypothetical protein